MEMLSKEQEIIKILFKDFLNVYNSRSISKIAGVSHAGAFKILKRLEKRNIVSSAKIGKAIIYSLNLENPIAIREIEMILTIEAQSYKRWIEEFAGLKDKSLFAILFGSVIRNEKEAKDIDLLVVVDKDNYQEIRKIINERNKILAKKVHLIIQSMKDFKKDVKTKNKAILEILKNGIVLFGQENIIKAM